MANEEFPALSFLISFGKIYAAAFVFHAVILLYLYHFRWHLQSAWELQWYLPRITRYLSRLMSLLSLVLSVMSVNTAADDLLRAYMFLASSCTLGVNSLVLSQATGTQPSVMVALVTTLVGIAACMPPVQYFSSPFRSGDVTIRLSVGFLNSFLGLTMIQMLLRDENDPEDEMWRQMNGNPSRMV